MNQEKVKQRIGEDNWFMFQVFISGKQGYIKGGQLNYYKKDVDRFCEVHKIR